MELEEYKSILTTAREPFLDLLSSCSTAELTQKPDQESWCSIETFQHLVQSDVYHFADILRPLNNDQFDLITVFGSKVESDTAKIFQTIPSPDGQMSKVVLLGIQNDIYQIFFEGLRSYADQFGLNNSTLHHPVFGDLRGTQWLNFYVFHDWNHYIQGAVSAKQLGVIPGYDPYGIPSPTQ